MGYKSPIELLCDDMMQSVAIKVREHNEMQIMAKVNQVVSIDKEELIKALNYDRHQYEKGYADAKAEYQRPQGEWIFKNGKYRCTACGEKAIYRYSGSLAVTQTELLTDFCPNCGADMRKGIQHEVN